MIKKYFLGFALSLLTLTSCSDFLDIVPDNVATIDNAFSMRETAERFLYTCYSYMPREQSLGASPSMIPGGELWVGESCVYQYDWYSLRLARGQQSTSSPILNYSEGWNGGVDLYQAIRDCNTFLERIDEVPGMMEAEKLQWKAEVTFLKAYYHFYMLRMYGPIPIIDKNLPISASPEEVKIYREPTDKCFKYVTDLLNDSIMQYLPVDIPGDDAVYLGRINQCIVKAVDAYVKVTAASKLFNGNTEFINLVDKDKQPMINPNYDSHKWDVAVEACKAAIDLCDSLGYKLYELDSTDGLLTNIPASYKEQARLELGLRSIIATREQENHEIIWRDTKNLFGDQTSCFMRNLADKYTSSGVVAATMKQVEEYYTENGLPIDEDKSWPYNERYKTKFVGSSGNYKGYIAKNRTTALLNFAREPRFYANIAFDGGFWFGNFKESTDSKFGTNQYYPGKICGLMFGEKSNSTTGAGGMMLPTVYMATGYGQKKLINLKSKFGESSSTQSYAWPLIRLADLYLLYAEALNEKYKSEEMPEDVRNEVFKYVDAVRKRAGLKGVEETWTSEFSKYPDKPYNYEGRRDIIRQERRIELAFEGKRFWDERRWMTAMDVFNCDYMGWNVWGKTPTEYYQLKTVYTREFTLKDYFWPYSLSSIQENSNLVQNYLW